MNFFPDHTHALTLFTIAFLILHCESKATNSFIAKQMHTFFNNLTCNKCLAISKLKATLSYFMLDRLGYVMLG